MSITLRSRSRTTVICTLQPSPINTPTRPTNRFRLVVTHGMHIHPSVRTSTSESRPGPERATPPPLHLSLIPPSPLRALSSSIVPLLSGFPANYMLYLVLVLTSVLSYSLPYSPHQVHRFEVSLSRSRPFLLPLRRSPLTLSLRLISLLLLSCFHLISTVMCSFPL
jgi:hypothetical protein